jgi:hypothetical protein
MLIKKGWGKIVGIVTQYTGLDMCVDAIWSHAGSPFHIGRSSHSVLPG